MVDTNYQPGTRVRVTQQLPFGEKVHAATVEGEILRVGQQKTGSWYAHSKDKKLWLDRLELRRDDGEIVVINLEPYTRVEPVEADSETDAG